jgi:multidrug efflux pump subunit AcrA (membrane-fusion protein)
MTAVVDIQVDRLEDVLSIPVQAVVQVERDNWCYVQGEGGIERRNIRLGRSNDKFVEVRGGLEPGVEVVLNPMAIVAEAEDREPRISPEP